MFDSEMQSYVFVEVKSIQNEKVIAITQTISKIKALRLKVAARKWISRKLNKWCSWRIDFIGIVLDNTKVVHIQSAIW
jgi:Holliday junction resolvase-like predicted endonuclease